MGLRCSHEGNAKPLCRPLLADRVGWSGAPSKVAPRSNCLHGRLVVADRTGLVWRRKGLVQNPPAHENRPLCRLAAVARAIGTLRGPMEVGMRHVSGGVLPHGGVCHVVLELNLVAP